MGRRKIETDRLGDVLISAIALAEEMFGPKSGAQKKAFVTDLINDKIDIPFMGERAEGKAISLLIDVLCAVTMKRLL
tara:strand:- start:41 stop:271 length:231 start_codon:yes stop_codon:yes gene_type:complete